MILDSGRDTDNVVDVDNDNNTNNFNEFVATFEPLEHYAELVCLKKKNLKIFVEKYLNISKYI